MTLGGVVMGTALRGCRHGERRHSSRPHRARHLERERGLPRRYVSASNSLTRGRMIRSTTGLVVNFSAGPKTISMVAPADRMVVMDESGHAAIEGVLTAVGVTIDRAAGAFRALQFLTAGSLRWVLQVTGAADNFDIRRYDDAGAFTASGSGSTAPTGPSPSARPTVSRSIRFTPRARSPAAPPPLRSGSTASSSPT